MNKLIEHVLINLGLKKAKKKIIKNNTYSVTVFCCNCYYTYSMEIPKGKIKTEYLKEYVCKECGVKGKCS